MPMTATTQTRERLTLHVLLTVYILNFFQIVALDHDKPEFGNGTGNGMEASNPASPAQCFLRVSSRIASSSPPSVSGYIDPCISSWISLVDCE